MSSGVHLDLVSTKKQQALAPSHYLRRHRKWSIPNNWEEMEWGKLNPKDFLEAELHIKSWNSSGFHPSWEYKLPLFCDRCYTVVSETYPAIGLVGMIGKHVCMKCHLEGLAMKKNTLIGAPMTKPTLVRKEGDIWKLPKSSSPMWTNQWGYQGSSKTPYIISHNSQKKDGSATEDGWACSCPNFTRHTPRTPCKHILNVKLNEGIATPKKAQTQLANLDDKTAAEFEKWQREKAAAKTTPTAGDAALKLFGATGRKFR